MPKIGLDQIIVTDNIRKNYTDIDELADSIKKRGQLEPVIVKKADPGEDGEARYELVAGFRRLRAIQLLRDKGEGYTQIDAVIVTGDRLAIQLIENLQRTDLSAREREEGIALMVQGGLSQKEVAAELSKKADYISRHMKAYEIRGIAEEAQIDTSDLETFTLTEIATVKKEDIPMILGYVKKDGGTKEAARKVMSAYRGNREPAPTPEPSIDAVAPTTEEREEATTENKAARGSSNGDNDQDIDPLAGAEILPEPVLETSPHRRDPISRESTNPDHRIIDLQKVFDKIYEYLDRLKKKIQEAGAESEDGIIAQYKIDAAYDIVAELHQVEVDDD